MKRVFAGASLLAVMIAGPAYAQAATSDNSTDATARAVAIAVTGSFASATAVAAAIKALHPTSS